MSELFQPTVDEYGITPVTIYQQMFDQIIKDQSPETLWSMITDDPMMPVVNGDKIVWFQRQVAPIKVLLTGNLASMATAISVAAGDEVGFHVNDLVQIDANIDETMRVTSTASGVINVERGYAGSDDTQTYSTGDTLYVLGTAPKDSDSGFDTGSESGTPYENEFLRFHAVYGTDLTAEATSHYGGLPAGTKMANEQLAALTKMSFHAQGLTWLARKQRGSKTQSGSFNGVIPMILEQQDLADPSRYDFTGNPLTFDAIGERIEIMEGRGGMPTHLFLHPSRAKSLATEALTNSTMNTTLAENRQGELAVTELKTRTDRILTLVYDRSIRPGLAVPIRLGTVTRVWKRRLTVTDLAEDESDTRKQKMVGQMTLKGTNLAQHAEVWENVGV